MSAADLVCLWVGRLVVACWLAGTLLVVGLHLYGKWLVRKARGAAPRGGPSTEATTASAPALTLEALRAAKRALEAADTAGRWAMQAPNGRIVTVTHIEASSDTEAADLLVGKETA